MTSDGAWIDLSAQIGGVSTDVTLFYDFGKDAVTGSWCDAEVCDAPLEAKFSRQIGYRSFAWPGGAYGTRVITNPLDPGGNEESNSGTYLRFADGSFERLPSGAGNFRASGAFANSENGWLEGPVEISRKTPPPAPPPWPVSVRAPLSDVTGAPGAPIGSLNSGALAVGADGSVVRYHPRARLEARVPADLERRRQQGQPARRRLARTGARPRGRRSRRDVDLERGR